MAVVRRYLVVANQTLQRAELRDELRNRTRAEPSLFYLLVRTPRRRPTIRTCPARRQRSCSPA